MWGPGEEVRAATPAGGPRRGAIPWGPTPPGSPPPTHHRLSPFADLRSGAAARAPPRGEGARGRPPA